MLYSTFFEFQMKKFPVELQFTTQNYQFHDLDFVKMHCRSDSFRFGIGFIHL